MLNSFLKLFSVGLLGVGVTLVGVGVYNKNAVTEATTTIVSATATPVKIITSANTPVVSNFTNDEKPVVLLKPGNDEQLIIFNTPVVYETVEATIARLESLKAKGYKEAFLILDSPGGSVFDGARLVAWINHSPMKVNTICDGLCASMAAHLFEVGKTRYMTDKSTLMFHPASGGVSGTLQQMNSRLTYISNYVDGLDKNIATRSGMDYNTFHNRMLVEYWVETSDAVKNNLADNLIFVSYNRSAPGALNMDDHMKKLNKVIPEDLRKIGILRLDTIRLSNGNTL